MSPHRPRDKLANRHIRLQGKLDTAAAELIELVDGLLQGFRRLVISLELLWKPGREGEAPSNVPVLGSIRADGHPMGGGKGVRYPGRESRVLRRIEGTATGQDIVGRGRALQLRSFEGLDFRGKAQRP